MKEELHTGKDGKLQLGLSAATSGSSDQDKRYGKGNHSCRGVLSVSVKGQGSVTGNLGTRRLKMEDSPRWVHEENKGLTRSRGESVLSAL